MNETKTYRITKVDAPSGKGWVKRKKHSLKYLMMVLMGCSLFLLSSCKKDNRSLVVSKIQSAAKLATTETIMSKVVVGTKERKWGGLVTIGRADFLANTKATVKAGIDMSKLQPEDIKISEGRIELVLPSVEVLDFSYPFKDYKVDMDITRNGFLTKMTVEDHENLYRQAEIDIRANLKYMGIIEETELHTTQLMTGLLKNLGYQEIYISYKPDGEFIPQIILDGGPDDPNANPKKKKWWKFGKDDGAGSAEDE